MGKTSDYATDQNITLLDKVLGSDADDSNSTKNYTFAGIIAFLNNQGFSNTIPTQVTKVAKTTITTAQVLSLYTTPITILDSSETGKVKVPISVYIKRNAGTSYTLASSSFSIINDFESQMNSNLNPNPLISSGVGYFQSAINVIQNLSGGEKNLLYKLQASTGNPTLGTGDLDVYVTYFEITL
jgi:hypothetical protein